jgi:hypothetical protein
MQREQYLLAGVDKEPLYKISAGPDKMPFDLWFST